MMQAQLEISYARQHDGSLQIHSNAPSPHVQRSQQTP